MEQRLLDLLSLLLQEVLEGDLDLHDDGDELREALRAHGYDDGEIELGLEWLDNYIRSAPGVPLMPSADQTGNRDSFRVLSPDERRVIEPEAYGFLVGLQSRGVIGADTREEILHRLSDLFEDAVGIEEMKMVTLLTVFEHGALNLDELVNLMHGSDLHATH